MIILQELKYVTFLSKQKTTFNNFVESKNIFKPTFFTQCIVLANTLSNKVQFIRSVSNTFVLNLNFEIEFNNFKLN
jgi:hypothetical protein